MHNRSMRPPRPLPPTPRSGLTAAQATALGITRARLRNADVAHPFQGINVPGRAPLTLEDRCRSLQLKMPAAARFCGLTAAILVGVPLPAALERSTAVHVAVPRGSRTLVGRGVRGHTFLRTPSDVRDWHGLRLSSPERIWCELAADLPLDHLVAAGDFLIHHRLPHTTVPLLNLAVENWPGRRGRPALERALPLLNDRAESAQESRLRVILTMGGVSGLVANFPITTQDGYRYRVDLALPHRRVFIEYQSDEFHSNSRRADMTRISRLQADDWVGVEVNADDLDNPVELCARIQRIVAQRIQ